MPKWLIVLLTIAVLAGVILLEQMELTPSAPPASSRPATVAPATPVAVPQPPSESAPTPATRTAPQTPSGQVDAPSLPSLQTPSLELAPGGPSPDTVETPVGRLTPQSPSDTVPLALEAPAVVSPEVVPTSDARWAGMPVHDFLMQASGELVRLSPETVTWLGISEDLGMRDDRLDSLTGEAEEEYYGLAQAIVNHLATYDVSRETPDVRLNAEIYRAFLLDSLEGYAFTDNYYSVSSYMDSYPTYIAWFLTSLHPLETPTNAEDYVSRLLEIPERFRELEARLADSEALNAVPPRFMLENAVEQLRQMEETPTRDTEFYTALASAVEAMDGVDEPSAAALLDRAASAIESEVLPAYRELGEYVSGMAARASDDAGVWKQANGDEFYAYCLRSYTTTNLTAAEIFDLGVAEVARIEGEIREAASAAGLDASLSIAEIYEGLSERTGVSLGEETIARCQAILDDIGPRIASAFLRMPARELVVVDGGYDTYFSAGTLDGSRPGQYFAPTLSPQPIYGLPTTTYHEGIPGHGFQAAYAYEADIPPYIAGISFTAYSEGWALYAERLAWEMGVYDEDPYANLGRLQDELFRATRLVLDPGIHAKRWTYEQAVAYMLEHTGFDETYARAEVERYIVSPAQAVTYKIGMIEILRLREKAEQALGDAFDLARFHETVLGHGELPLGLLERRVDEYVRTTLAERASRS